MSSTAATLESLRNKPTPGNLPTAGAKPRTMNDIVALPRPRQFPAMLDSFKREIALALPQHITADRMARLALTAFNSNPALATCDPKSIFASVILASQLGLELGVDGQAYLVPYKGKATMVTGWKGHVALVNNAKMATVWTGVVFKGDKFDYQLGDQPFVHHKPMGESDEVKDNITHTYAVGRIVGQEWPVIEVWPIKKIIRHLSKYNKVGASHYALSGDAGFIGYARKVPLLQVVKYLPRSVQQQIAAAAERNADLDLSAVLEGEFSNVVLNEGTDGPEDENTGARAGETVDKGTGEVVRDENDQQATGTPPVELHNDAVAAASAPAAGEAEPEPSPEGKAESTSRGGRGKRRADLDLT